MEEKKKKKWHRQLQLKFFFLKAKEKNVSMSSYLAFIMEEIKNGFLMRNIWFSNLSYGT